MTTVQLKQLYTVEAVRPASAGKTSAVAVFETTQQDDRRSDPVVRITVAALVDCWKATSDAKRLTETALVHMRSEFNKADSTVEARLKHAIERANTVVYEKSGQDSKISVIIAAFSETKAGQVFVQLAHNGNCRAYFWPGNLLQAAPVAQHFQLDARTPIEPPKLQQLTKDHTWGQQNVDREFLNIDEKDNYKQQWDTPLQYLGAGEQITPDLSWIAPPARESTPSDSIKLQRGDRILLCTASLPAATLERILQSSKEPLGKLAKTLVQQAPTAETDAAVVLIEHRQPRPSVDWPVLIPKLLRSVFLLILIVALGLLLFLLWANRTGIASRLRSILPPAIITLLQTPTPTPTASPPTTPSPTAIATDAKKPNPTAIAAATGLLTPASLPTSTPTPTATSAELTLNTPIAPTPPPPPTTPPITPPTVIPTQTLSATFTPVVTGTVAPFLKTGPQATTLRGEKPYPEDSKEKLTFQWSATRDTNRNEGYRLEILSKATNLIVYSDLVATEELQIPVAALQGKDLLVWHVRTESQADHTPTSEWSEPQNLKVTVQDADESKPDKPAPKPCKKVGCNKGE